MVCVQLRAVALEEVFEGDISFISHLVRESGINLDERDAEVSVLWLVTGVDCDLLSFTLQDGGTALIWSSLNGHTEISEMLIECGASLNVQTKVSFTSALQEILAVFYLADF